MEGSWWRNGGQLVVQDRGRKGEKGEGDLARHGGEKEVQSESIRMLKGSLNERVEHGREKGSGSHEALSRRVSPTAYAPVQVASSQEPLTPPRSRLPIPALRPKQFLVASLSSEPV